VRPRRAGFCATVAQSQAMPPPRVILITYNEECDLLRARGKWAGMPWTMLQRFLLQLGFLDGDRGALIAWTAGRTVWMKCRKLGMLAGARQFERPMWPQGEVA
jgi:hypothetical protein